MDYDNLKSEMKLKGFKFGFKTRNCDEIAFGKGYNTALLYQIIVDNDNKIVTYEISSVFSDDYLSTYPFKNYEDIIIPENDDEFSKLAKDKRVD